MKILKKFYPKAFIVGIITAIILTIGFAELLLQSDYLTRNTCFPIIFKLSYILSFIIAGYITAFIANKNPLLNVLYLGGFFVLLKFWGIINPSRSDPIIHIILEGIICLTSCLIGGFIRKGLSKNKGI